MSNITVNYKLTLSSNEAMSGTKKVLTRKGKRLEITIPAGVKTGSLVKLSGALQITDGYYGDILVQIKVKRYHRHKVLAAVLTALAITCFFIVIYFLNEGIGENPRYIYINGAIATGGNGEPIELIDNPDATNPTYAELVAFIKADTTDTKGYVEESLAIKGLRFEGYVCADFAEDVHNNAEAAGIRAAWVGIDFYEGVEGHALNAFETTDRGLVYIDCTGGTPGGLGAIAEALKQYGRAPPSKPTSWDTVAYVDKGKEYGLIDIDKAKSLSYSFYEECNQKWQLYERLLTDYNEEVTRYSRETAGKVYYEGSTELARIEAWEARLSEKGEVINELGEELSDYWVESLGVVKDIYIHWGNN